LFTMNLKSLFFIATLFFSASCMVAQHKNGVAVVEFSTLSMRGYAEKIRITSDSVWITMEERREASSSKTHGRKLTSQEWSQLMKATETVSIAEVPALKSPTMARAFDGAMHSSITLQTIHGTGVSHSFDNENPHEKLQLLMKTIREIVQNTPER
ncbi:MAG: hypothetical protein V4714_03180, partial [Bacteroidota bacterium]